VNVSSVPEVPDTLVRPRHRQQLSLGLASVTAVTVAALAVSDGGYGPTTWGWATLWLLWLTALALVLRGTIRVDRSEVVHAAALATLAIWIGASSLWSDDAGRSILEVQRVLVYVAAAGALLIVRRNTVSYLIGGVLSGAVVVAAYALATRLVPDRFGGGGAARYAAYRLQEPIGYWNALGILCTMAAILAVCFAAEARSLVARALAACAFLVVSCTLYFTFSRGAWLALFVGVFVMVAVSPRRLTIVTTLLALAPTSIVAVWVASGSNGLTREISTAGQTVNDGHRFGVLLLALLPITAGIVTLAAIAQRRLRGSRALRRGYAGTLLVAAAAVVVGIVVTQGGPVAIGERLRDGFVAPAPRVHDLNDRLLNLSSNGRLDLWSVALDEASRSTLHGSGAGTFERNWLQHRTTGLKVRDAHSLYLETLGELGVVGLALLAVALLAPLRAVALAGVVHTRSARSERTWPSWCMPRLTGTGR
jgi:hypothetical protein